MDNLLSLAYDPTFDPERIKSMPVKDTLFLEYPSKADNITKARQAGYTDQQIRSKLAERETFAILEKGHKETNEFFKRDENTQKELFREMSARLITGYSEATGKTPKEVWERMKSAELFNMSPSAFVYNDELYEKMTKNIEKRRSIFESARRGAQSSSLQESITVQRVKNMVMPSPEGEKLLKDMQGELEKIEQEPMIHTIQNKAVQGAVNNAVAWFDKKDFALAAAGAAGGSLFGGPVGAAGGAAIGFSSSFISRMFLRDSMPFYDEMKKANVPDELAVPSSVAYGAVSAIIEFGQAATLVSSFGGSSVLGGVFAGAKSSVKNIMKGIIMHPQIAKKLATSTAIEATKDVAETVAKGAIKKAAPTALKSYVSKTAEEVTEEMAQRTAEIVISEATKMINSPEYKHMSASEALISIAQTGLDSLPSMALLMAPGAIATGVSRKAGVVSKAKDLRESAMEAFSVEVPQVFIPKTVLETYFQDNPEQAESIRTELGIAPDREIAGTGEVMIPEEIYQKTSEANPSFSEATKNELRKGAEGVTEKESAEIMAKRLIDPLEDWSDGYADEARQIRGQMIKQLREAGQDTELAQANADLYARSRYALGKMLNKSPMELYNIDVQKGIVQGGQGDVFAQSVYHGTHVKGIKKLLLEKIGTGEGARVYGYGIYSSKAKEVAKTYREQQIQTTGQSMSDFKFSGKTAMEWYNYFEKSTTKGQLKYELMALLEDFEIKWDSGEVLRIAKSDEFNYSKEAIKWFTDTIHKNKEKPGAIYKLNIPDDSVMLDLDKPFIKQSAKVKTALKESGIWKEFKENKSDFSTDASTRVDNGFGYYNFLTAKLGSDKNASEYLKSIGILGNKYLDADSRDKGKGTHNYVLFDEDAIQILEEMYNQDRRGQIAFSEKQSLITLFEKSDKSTFVHEMAHALLEDLIRYGYGDTTGSDVANNLEIALKYLGISDFDFSKRTEFTAEQKAKLTKAHEKWAKSFETYLMTGKAPSVGLKAVFKKMKSWLIDIYNHKKLLDKKVSPAVNQLFDRLLATKEEIDQNYKKNTKVRDVDSELQAINDRLEEINSLGEKDQAGKVMKMAEGLSELLKAEGYKTGIKEGKRLAKELADKRKALKKVREDIKDSVKLIQKRAKSTNIIYGAQLEIKELLSQYVLKKLSNKKLEDARQNLAMIQKDPDFASSLTRAQLAYTKVVDKVNLNDMTLYDVQLLLEKVDNIYYRGERDYAVKKAETEARRKKFFDAMHEKVDSVIVPDTQRVVKSKEDARKKYKGISGKVEQTTDWINSAIRNRVRFFDWLDGGEGKYKGVFYELFVEAFANVKNEEYRWRKIRTENMKKVFAENGLTGQDLQKHRIIDGEDYTVQNLIAVYAGLKNDKSRQALIDGNFAEFKDLALDHATKCVMALTPAERAIGDAIIADYDANFDRFNASLIEARNKGIIREPNYSPMHRLEYATSNGMMDAIDAIENMLSSDQNNAILAQLENSMLIERLDISKEGQKPIDLDIYSLWQDQVKQQEHIASHMKLLLDVFNVILTQKNGKTIGQKINKAHGKVAAKAFRAFVNASVRDDVRMSGDVTADMSGRLGFNMAVTYLAGNLSTYLVQLTAMPRFLVAAGPTQILASIAQFQANPNFMEDIFEIDPQMRERFYDTTLRYYKVDESKLGNVSLKYKKFIDAIMSPLASIDQRVAAIGWNAVYQAQLANGASPQEAVSVARRTVKLTQQQTEGSDMPMLWQQGGLGRLLIIFTNEASQIFGMSTFDMAASIKRGSYPKVLRDITALMMTAVTYRIIKQGPPDEDETWAEYLLKAFSRQEIESIPIIGKEVSGTWDQLMWEDRTWQTNSVFAAPIIKILNGPKDIFGEKSEKVSRYTGLTGRERGIWNVIEGISLLSGAVGSYPLPVTAAKRVYTATKSEDAISAVQTLIGQQKKIKKITRGVSF